MSANKEYAEFARGDIAHLHAEMKRIKGETLISFAERMYNWQMEVYSSYCGHDIHRNFFSQPLEIRQQWINAAKRHPEFNKGE